MSVPAVSRTDYLEQLRDRLPYRDGPRILEEVDGWIEDRIEAEREQGVQNDGEAERRALEAMGSPERLASELIASSVSVDLGTRRTFTRMLAATFATHLLLSIVLTVAGASRPAIAGLLGPLPREPLGAMFAGVVSIFLLDTGALFLIFALLGRGKAPPQLPTLRIYERATRRDAALALVLLGLVALILFPFRDQIFAVRDGDRMVGIFADDVVALMPAVGAALGLLAIRQVTTLLARGESPVGIAADALASLVLALVLAYAATRPELVHFPHGSLGQRAAAMLSDMTTRVLLLVFVGAAVFLLVRFIKRCFRLRQRLAAA